MHTIRTTEAVDGLVHVADFDAGAGIQGDAEPTKQPVLIESTRREESH